MSTLYKNWPKSSVTITIETGVHIVYNIDNKYKKPIEIDYEDIASKVIHEAEDFVECPYDCEVNLLITDNDEIQTLNKESRDIDAPTDVLSFPMLEKNE